MKAMIGLGIYAKPDMVSWMFSGITENFPKDTAVAVFNEAEDDDTQCAIQNGMWEHFEDWPGAVNVGSSRVNILEHGVHRQLIPFFMGSDCDVLIIPQDDNRFQRPLLPDLQKLWDKYGTDLGWISGRDGHGFGYEIMVCSPFSDSTGANKTVLDIGDYREVIMMNTGPVVYFRHVIEKVGMPPADMPWYWWSFYSLQCHHAGLTNILLSMDCLHEKFGRVGNNPALFDDALVARCLKTFNDRWSPIYGRNPL